MSSVFLLDSAPRERGGVLEQLGAGEDLPPRRGALPGHGVLPRVLLHHVVEVEHIVVPQLFACDDGLLRAVPGLLVVTGGEVERHCRTSPPQRSPKSDLIITM